MNKNFIYILISIYFLISCSNTKYLPNGQSLYVGSKIQIKASNKADKKEIKAIKEELQSLIRPLPNSKILGLRIKLFSYNIAGTPTGKGLRYFLKNKLGEPPVLSGQVNVEKNSQVLQNRLENRGFFGSAITADTAVKKRKMTVMYDAELAPRYHIRNVSFKTDSSEVSKEIIRVFKGSRLKPGKPYDLDIIKEERDRIDSRLKNRGFFYFRPDYIIVNVDSTIGDHKVDMVLEIKKETPEIAKKIFRINDIIVYADYMLGSEMDTLLPAENFEGYKIIDPKKKYNPHIFSRSLVFKSGDVYNRNNHNLSLSRLVDLGVFQFVKMRFEKVDTLTGNFLNAIYYLSAVKKKSIRAELSALTKSNNANGADLTISWRNRNLLKGAELLTVSAFGGFEKQISGQQGRINTIRFGVDVNLYASRIVGPFKFKTNSGFVPKTKASIGYEIFNRNTQYTLNSFKSSLGYIFKDDITKEHQLNILSLTYVNPINITPAFQKQLDTNITLRRSIERQFIIGSTYNYNINTQAKPNRKRHNFYFNGNIDLSGNILGLVTGGNVNAGRQKTIFDMPFSQYVRGEVEGRYYMRLGRNINNVWANRLLIGVGYAYGNSNTMPFVKQFFIGGTNSIRAYRARSLGPGKYYGGNVQSATGFLPDQPGDIKIELNTELRAKLFSIVQGAFFIDAGNIWLRKEDSLKPGSKFTRRFLQDFAVGTGLGLRFDVKFLVLRFDVAFPIRKPYLPQGSKWVFNEINFGNSEWRKNNLVYNLSIGYPF